MLDAFLKQLQLETSYQMLKHIHRLFCEIKIHRSVIPQ